MSRFIIHMIIIVLALSPAPKTFASEKKLRIYAAASLGPVLTELIKYYGDKSILLNLAATSKLAKQIEAGAPADLFFSADEEWMNYLAQRNKLILPTKVDLLSNRMVVIVSVDSDSSPRTLKDLLQPQYRHIALASETVPAGKFAREALRKESIDENLLKKKITHADNVRIVLNWIANKEVKVGMVYFTDAVNEPRVKTTFVVSDQSHSKIIYSAAIVKQSSHTLRARNFIEFCLSPEAKKIFIKAGFIII